MNVYAYHDAKGIINTFEMLNIPLQKCPPTFNKFKTPLSINYIWFHADFTVQNLDYIENKSILGN